MRAGPQLSGRDRCQLLLWQGEEHPFWRKHLSPGIGRINGGESLPCEKVPRPAVAGEPGLPARHGLCRPTPTPVIVQWGGISSRWPLHFGSSRCTSTRLSELTLRPWESKSPTRSRIPLMWRTCSVWESQGQDSCLALFPEHLYLLCLHGPLGVPTGMHTPGWEPRQNATLPTSELGGCAESHHKVISQAWNRASVLP